MRCLIRLCFFERLPMCHQPWQTQSVDEKGDELINRRHQEGVGLPIDNPTPNDLPQIIDSITTI